MEALIEPGMMMGDKFLVGDYIGSGGMGAVYEATHVGLDRKVAIKVLKYFESGDTRAIARFHREARASGLIGHDNICDVTDFGVDEAGRAYLVMPLLQGSSFAELLKREAPLKGARIVDIVCQTLRALEAAHNHDIIHRDLKPANIFVTTIGDRDDFVKLLDFGISKYVEPDTATALTRTGLVPGTPLYMSPEQAEGYKYLDLRSDIYSVGVILYEAFTSTLPFKGDSYNEIVIGIVTKPFVPPRAHNPSIPEAVERIILTAMSRDPLLRYKNAKEMRLALEAIDSQSLEITFGGSQEASIKRLDSRTVHESREVGEPVRSRSPETTAKQISSTNKQRLIVLLTLINALLVLLGVIGYVVFYS